MRLCDEGLLDLYAPVSRYLNWFKVQSDYGPITPHHLVSHTSGLVTGADIGPHGYYEAWALEGPKRPPSSGVLPLLEHRVQDVTPETDSLHGTWQSRPPKPG